ncbi:hypothetical protein [uncultured Nonlabens sp.]|uniref:hypothetical protein n=1 Tax=uncultured Nonlabens sp. TaxID=859306 RepID=UPI00260A28A6|nr:hypothetical protein [uncultured Nonlabens sp.]
MINFLRNNGLKIGAIIMLLISIIVFRKGFVQKEIFEKNKQVTVIITDCQNNGRRGHFLKLNYKGKKYVKRIKKSFCDEIKDQNTLKMLVSDSENELNFLNEYRNNNAFFLAIIFLSIAIAIIFKSSIWRIKLA